MWWHLYKSTLAEEENSVADINVNTLSKCHEIDISGINAKTNAKMSYYLNSCSFESLRSLSAVITLLLLMGASAALPGKIQSGQSTLNQNFVVSRFC